MKPTLAFHNINRMVLGDIHYFPAGEDRAEGFWTRTLIFEDKSGDKFYLPLFTHIGAGAITLSCEPPREPETLDEAIDALGPLLAPLPANAFSDGEPRVTEAPEPTLTREESGRFEAALRETAGLPNPCEQAAILAELEAGFAAPEMMTPRETVCDVCGCPGDLSRAEAPGAGETWACEPCQDGSARK